MPQRKYVGAGVWVDDPGPSEAQASTQKVEVTQTPLETAFEDVVATRFLTHLPTSELESADRLFFQIEQAHWYDCEGVRLYFKAVLPPRFYEDFLADAPGAKLPHMHLRVFAQNMFARCALLKPLKGYHETLFSTFREYKNKIPVCGCILLDESLTKVVLVRNWQKTCWGLPKGKINQNESKPACAAREVLEETGLDVGDGLDERNAIELINDTQTTTMFVVMGVPLDFPFAPRVRKEISKIAFFPLDDLPSDQRNVDKFLIKLRRMLKTRKKHVAVYGQTSTTSVEVKEQDEDEEHEPVDEKRPHVAELFPPSDYSGLTFGPPFVVDEVELARVIRDSADHTYSRQFGTETHRHLSTVP